MSPVFGSAERAGWRTRRWPRGVAGGGTRDGADTNGANGTGSARRTSSGGRCGDRGGAGQRGQGFAFARYLHSRWPGFGAAWSAWVADVDVHCQTGEVVVRRVVVGHDAGLMVNPAGVRHQIHGNVVQTTSRALKESVQQQPATGAVANREWGSYPILSFREVPVIEVLTMPRSGEPPLGAGESSSVPGTAAIANAIFDATGVRLREPPFTPEKVRAALGVEGAAAGTARAMGALRRHGGRSPGAREAASATPRDRGYGLASRRSSAGRLVSRRPPGAAAARRPAATRPS